MCFLVFPYSLWCSSMFAVWLMGAWDFCVSCSGLMGNKLFSLSVT